jgi:hypothetical protein
MRSSKRFQEVIIHAGGEQAAAQKALLEWLLASRQGFGTINEVRMKKVKKGSLADSGGLDTSILVKWLKDAMAARS